MRGIQVNKFGEPAVLNYQELTDLVVSADDVLVEIHAVGINPVETYIRSGNYAVKPTLPYTPGSDGAGIILEVGENVKDLTVDQRVFIAATGGRSSGTYAEQVVCDQGSVFPLPGEVSFVEGAALGTTGLTASRALFQKARLLPGEFVLIHGATGGVGTLAVQLAKLHGAIVIATAGSPAGEKLLHELGADVVLNHRSENYLEEINELTDLHGIDVVVEMLADINLQKDLEIMGLHGRIVIVGNRGEITINPRLAINRDVKILGMLAMNMTEDEKQENLYRLNAALAHGVSPIIQDVMPLSDADLAHKKIIAQKSTLGKIILTTDKHENGRTKLMEISDYFIDLPEGSLEEQVRALFEYYQLEKTYHHSLEVALEAQRLAPKFNLDAKQAFTAGILHDTGGVIPNEVRVELAQDLGLEVFDAEKELPLLLHQQFSKVLGEQLFNIRDEAVLAAVSSHTTLRPQASQLDKLIFIADKIKWDRDHRAPYLETVQEKIETSLDATCLAYLDWAFETGMPVVHPYAKIAYEELKNLRSVSDGSF